MNENTEYKSNINRSKIKPFQLGSYIVTKPWGKEEWIELTDSYCVKIIYINANFSSSLQYHKEKIETALVLDGWITLELENENEILEKHEIRKGFGWTIKPYQKHRIIASVNCKILEVQTPQLDDVIRIEDIYNRPNGKIKSEHNE